VNEVFKIIDVPTAFKNDFSTLAQQNLMKKYASICLLGVTGHGKSFTANTLIGGDYFKVSCHTESETSEVKGAVRNFRGVKSNPPVIVIDTPGIGDSKGRDTQHIAKMVFSLKRVGYVNTFLIAVNSEDPRMNDQLQQTLSLFQQMFGNDFFKNAIICFTKFGYDKKSETHRKKGLKNTE
jgi:predicted GTPase